MAHEGDVVQVAAVGGGVVAHPAHRGGAVLEEVGKARFREDAVVGDDGEEAALGQGLADEAVQLALPGLPAAAIEEDDDAKRRLRLGRHVDVELLPGVAAVGEAVVADVAVLRGARVSSAASGEQAPSRSSAPATRAREMPAPRLSPVEEKAFGTPALT